MVLSLPIFKNSIMKIYKPEPLYIIRLQIIRQGDKTEYINLCETNMDAVKAYCIKLIEKQRISPFVKGKVTAINIRESTAGKNGKSISVSFKGISPKETRDLIVKSLPIENKALATTDQALMMAFTKWASI